MTACGAALFGGFVTLYARGASALPAQALRPPGALDEEAFLGACVRCGLCVRDCPYETGALDPGLTDIDDARMGVAVLIDQQTCLNFLGLRCDVCYRVCPLIDEAITLELDHNERTGKHTRFLPTVNAEVCTGCGKCEAACVLEVAAIKVLPTDVARGQLGRHYRLGWEEKAKAGESLIQGIIDLPDRMPGNGGLR